MDNGDSTLGNRDLTVVAVALEPLENGTYTVAWKNVPTVEVYGVRGFASSVGEPISPVALEVPEQPLFQSPSEPWLRWLVLLSTLAVIGGFSFELLAASVASSPHADGLYRDPPGTRRPAGV